MSPQLHAEMFALLTDLRYDKQTRVIVLTGAGDNFCAGQDLKQYSLEMENQPERVRDEVREKVRRWRNEMLRTLPQPVVARITGCVSAEPSRWSPDATLPSRRRSPFSACRKLISAIFPRAIPRLS
jgi:enoyl-CoA hydratase/carnithine racemase